MSNERFLKEAQDYLTISTDGQKQLIVGIYYLSENHSPQEIIRFLKEFLHEREKEMKQIIFEDKTSIQLDKTIAIVFRLNMAIMTLEKEVNHIVRIKRRTAGSGSLRKRDRRRHRSSGKRQNKNHDGEDWQAGYRTRRAA